MICLNYFVGVTSGLIRGVSWEPMFANAPSMRASRQMVMMIVAIKRMDPMTVTMRQ